MAAEGRIIPGDRWLYQNHYSPKAGEQLTYKNYLKGLNVNDVLSRTVSVVGGASGGASIGGFIGGATGGPAGAITGMAIGGAVGFVTSVSCHAGSDYMYYSEYRDKLEANAKLKLDEVVNEKIDLDYVCAISGQVPNVPVRIRGEKQVYERDVLEQWVKKKGTSPMTVKNITQGDILIAEDALLNSVVVCDRVLNDPTERTKYAGEFLQGFAVLRKGTLEIAEKSYQVQATALLQDLMQKKISPQNFKIKTAELADFYHRLLGEEVCANRDGGEQKNDD
jgi:hypothetical protein